MADYEPLEESDSPNFLGMHLDRGLTWNDTRTPQPQNPSLCSKGASGIYVLHNIAKFVSMDVLKAAYFGFVNPHIMYKLRLWISCSKNKFQKVLMTQKKAVRVISKLNPRKSCQNAFRELGFLSLPCLYVLYCRLKCDTVRGRNVHLYGTRGRDYYRINQNGTIAFQNLPTQIGAKVINRLPEDISKLNCPQKFKVRLIHHLGGRAFYPVDEFMENRWENICNMRFKTPVLITTSFETEIYMELS